VNVSSYQMPVSLLCILIAFSCESKKETETVAQPPSSPSVPSPSAPKGEAKKEPEKPWFAGTWRGKSRLSEELSVEDQDASARGERLSGQALEGLLSFQLQLSISVEDVTGMAKLGEHEAEVNGVLLEDSLRLSFRGDTLQGNCTGARGAPTEQSMFSCTARASTTITTEGRERVRRYAGSIDLEKTEKTK
jgi:hypothetical protein